MREIQIKLHIRLGDWKKSKNFRPSLYISLIDF